jgi:hypothetical protein
MTHINWIIPRLFGAARGVLSILEKNRIEWRLTANSVTNKVHIAAEVDESDDFSLVINLEDDGVAHTNDHGGRYLCEITTRLGECGTTWYLWYDDDGDMVFIDRLADRWDEEDLIDLVDSPRKGVWSQVMHAMARFEQEGL